MDLGKVLWNGRYRKKVDFVYFFFVTYILLFYTFFIMFCLFNPRRKFFFLLTLFYMASKKPLSGFWRGDLVSQELLHNDRHIWLFANFSSMIQLKKKLLLQGYHDYLKNTQKSTPPPS